MRPLLDTGHEALWTPDDRDRLDRCPSCEHHPETQGHDDYCPEVA